MPDELRQVIAAASCAAWLTVLIGFAWLILGWLIWLSFFKTKPAWVLKIWGGNISWQEVQKIVLTSMAVVKMILFVCILLALWLCLWLKCA